jgi:hypothetical protein
MVQRVVDTSRGVRRQIRGIPSKMGMMARSMGIVIYRYLGMTRRRYCPRILVDEVKGNDNDVH